MVVTDHIIRMIQGTVSMPYRMKHLYFLLCVPILLTVALSSHRIGQSDADATVFQSIVESTFNRQILLLLRRYSQVLSTAVKREKDFPSG